MNFLALYSFFSIYASLTTRSKQMQRCVKQQTLCTT